MKSSNIESAGKPIQLLIVLQPKSNLLLLVPVVKCDGNRRLRNARLSILVHQSLNKIIPTSFGRRIFKNSLFVDLKVLSSDMGKIGDAHEETYSIKNVAFA